MTRPKVVLPILLVAQLAGSGCGYSLAGRGAFLPSYIKTIGIPLFVNQTPVFNIEEILTQRVRTEFIGRGKYKVVPETTGVDAVLIGRVINIGLTPVSFTNQQQVSRYAVTVTAGFEFRDMRDDKVLWENPSLVFSEEYELTTGAGALDPSAFLGQESNAFDRVASNFSKAVVSAILEAF